jgi:HlyD family secretion protein
MQTQPPTNPQTTAQAPDSSNANRETVPDIRPVATSHPPTPPNSSLRPGPHHLPKKGHGWKRRGKWLIALLLLLALGGTGLGGWYFYAKKHTVRPDLLTHKITKEKLQITVTERGSLEPADNTFFFCKVKAKTPGGAATSIRWVIENGTLVKEGEKILELDDSALQDQKTAQEVAVINAKKALKDAEGILAVTRITDESAIAQNKVDVEVNKIILKEYLDGVYQQTRLDLQNKFDMAKSDLFMWNERAVWSKRMASPDRQYVTVSQAESDAARQKTAELTVKNFEKQLEVLDRFTKEKNRVQFQGNIDKAQRALEAAIETRDKNLAKNQAAVEAAELVYRKEKSRLEEIQEEIDNCLIRAPRDGMVIYYVEERARFGSSTAGVIAQGEQVKEGQKLVAVPDMRQMVVNARIHEAMVRFVSPDVVKYTGFSEAVNSALLFTPNALSGLSAWIAFDMDMQTAFAKEHEDEEKILERHGLPATVTVNAFSDRPFKAHVKSVAPVASQTDFFSSDVKVYQTYIAIDDSNLEGLKPGMDAVVSILVDSTPEPVVTIPLRALIGDVEMGAKRRCYVMVDGHPEPREVTVGKQNSTHAEVKDGLIEGDVVVLNPGMLLSDKEKVQYGVTSPSSQGGGDRGGSGDPGSKGGKGGRGGKGGKGNWKGGGAPGMPGGSPGMPGGGPGGRRGQGGAAPGGKAPANP